MGDFSKPGSKSKGGVLEKVNLDERLDEVLKLCEETRLLAAENLYKSLIKYINTLDPASPSVISIKRRLDTCRSDIDQMLERVALAKDALATSNDVDEDSDWIYGVKLFGVTTHYKVQDDGSLLLRLQGSREDLPLFEQLAVVHEVDLYPKWVPFCNQAKMLTKVTHSDLIAHFNIQMLMFSREAAVRFYGVDCLFEEGTVIFLGHSLETWEDPPIPWKPTGFIHDRLIFKEFKAMAKMESPTSAKIIVLANIDPRAPVPHFFRNFILQKLAGVIVYCMQSQAEKIVADPNCEHGQRMIRNKEFYADWLLPKFRAYCDYMRWPQPSIPALGSYGLAAGAANQHTHNKSSVEGNGSQKNEESKQQQLQKKSATSEKSNVSSVTDSTKPKRVVRFAQIVEEIDVDPVGTNALVEEAVGVFRQKKSLFDALDYLVSKNFIVVKPQNIAGFLLKYGSRFDEVAVGDLLGEDINMDDDGLLWSEVRYKFVRAAFFIEMDVETALRRFLTECGFKLPPDLSKVERLMQSFVRVYWEDNANTPYAPFEQMDEVFNLVMGMLSLNRSVYGPFPVAETPNVIMSETEFLSSLNMTSKLLELNRNYFNTIYHNILKSKLDDMTIEIEQIRFEDVEHINGFSTDTSKEIPDIVLQAVKMSQEKGRRPLQNAVRHLITKQFIGDSPKDVAIFLLQYKSLFDPGAIGDMLGEEGKSKEDRHRCSQMRYRYVRATSFVDMDIESALRKFLTDCGFRLPSDGQKIDCLVGTFVRVFWEDNHDTPHDPFKHMDTVHLLVLALILLDSDLHNPEVSESEKMTREMFIGDLHGVDRDKNNANDKPSDINQVLLSQMYDSVKRHSLHVALPSKMNGDMKTS